MNPIKFKESLREKDKIASKENPQLLICLSISRSHKPIRAEVKKMFERKCIRISCIPPVGKRRKSWSSGARCRKG